MRILHPQNNARAILVVALSAISIAPRHAQAKEANVRGAWLVDLDPDFGGHPDTIECTFKQDGHDVTGECGHGAPEPSAHLIGQVNEATLSFTFKTGRGEEHEPRFTASLAGNASTMKGEWRFVDDQGTEHRGNFSGRRQR